MRLGRTMPRQSSKAGLGGVWLGDAAQADLSVGCGGQDDVVRLNARELFEDGARGISQAGAALPHLQALHQPGPANIAPKPKPRGIARQIPWCG